MRKIEMTIGAGKSSNRRAVMYTRSLGQPFSGYEENTWTGMLPI